MIDTHPGSIDPHDRLRLPRQLRAPRPRWQADTDVAVVGSGIAGLTLALRLHEAGRRVLLLSKGVLQSGSTRWAQGGIAAALSPADTPAAHLADTLVAGAGVCDRDAVDLLVHDGPAAVAELIARGARFDRVADGELSLTREGGHHCDRIAHAGGDATGAEVSRALAEAVRAAPGIEVIEHALALDLVTDAGAVTGLTVHVDEPGRRTGVGRLRCGAVVLASGGLGQLYDATTNPAESTADGMAMALRAGAVLRDIEFVQFHPTVLWLGPDSRGQQPLVSEAVRGEGAILVDGSGRRVMRADDGSLVHPMADLAPRDVVAAAIVARLRATGTDHVYLDARAFGEQKWRRRFPTILAACRAHGIDPVTQPIPVAPAGHYSSGGVATDADGRASVPGLYACGEVACTGVHGANRLASNSLLEGLVFARRIAARLASADLPTPADGSVDGPVGEPTAGEPADFSAAGWLLDPQRLPLLRHAMTAGAGVLRDAAGLQATRQLLAELLELDGTEPPAGTAAWEATNLLTVAWTLVAAAAMRAESRGCHRRSDTPDPDDGWLGHIDSQLDAAGHLRTRFVPDPTAPVLPSPADLMDLQEVAS